MTTPELLQLIERLGVPAAFLVMLAMGVFVTGRELSKAEKRVEKLEAQTETVILLADRLSRLLAAQERNGRQP
jgi:hypothetical protein